ncbi:P-II family nitrogen regulator [Chloroflexota bacterium]
MKKVEAIVRRESLVAVQKALEEANYPGMTITYVRGHGRGRGVSQDWPWRGYVADYLPKVKVEIVLLDEDVDKTIDTIVKAARTGEKGDGKIFVLPVEGAVRVRTGDRDEKAI